VAYTLTDELTSDTIAPQRVSRARVPPGIYLGLALKRSLPRC
jgi:hypothetical protein